MAKDDKLKSKDSGENDCDQSMPETDGMAGPICLVEYEFESF